MPFKRSRRVDAVEVVVVFNTQKRNSRLGRLVEQDPLRGSMKGNLTDSISTRAKDVAVLNNLKPFSF